MEKLGEITEGTESHDARANGKTSDFKLNGVGLCDENATVNNII